MISATGLRVTFAVQTNKTLRGGGGLRRNKNMPLDLIWITTISSWFPPDFKHVVSC
jgi:hypothetical protein